MAQFGTKFVSILESLNKDEVKQFIGDSTNNNRNLTVNQLIRYLTNHKDRPMVEFGHKLYVARKILLTTMRQLRQETARSDAYDVYDMKLALDFAHPGVQQLLTAALSDSN